MMIQGSGGTGKTKSVIMTMKEFVDQVCAETESEYWKEYLLILAPTNLVALDIGGVTIDSGVLNRKAAESRARCSALVKLVLADEYSMVSLGCIAQISAALQESLLGEFQFSVDWRCAPATVCNGTACCNAQ